MDLPDSDRGDFSCRRAVNSSSYVCNDEIWSTFCEIVIVQLFIF